jgi:hypothetical protein
MAEAVTIKPLGSHSRPGEPHVKENRSSLRRWLLTAAKLLVVALVVWAVHGTIARALDELHKPQLREHPWTLQPGWLAAAGGLYLLGLLPEGLFWRRALAALGQNVSLGRTLRAYYIGHLGKYVPGKAMVVVLRTGMICGPGVDTGIAAASVFLETLTMMAVGALLAAAILAFGYARHGPWLWVSLAMMVAAGIPTLPPVFSRLARLLGVGRSNPAVAAKLAQFRYRTLLWGWVIMLAGWALMGASLWATLRALGVENVGLLGDLHLVTAAVALATVAGFVSLVPGGAVVREGVLVGALLLLLPQLGDVVALLTAIVLRLVWLVAELLISAILYFCGKETCGAEWKQ